MKHRAIGMFLLCICLQNGNSREMDAFEIYGNVMQILPLAMMVYSYVIDDMQGVKEQALGAGATLLSTHAIKQGFVIASRTDESYARISKRPDNSGFDGFPSGHTSWAFSAVGFSLKRYGWKFALPTALIATSVGVSRVHAQRHTTLQVISGALLGFSLSYLLSSKYNAPPVVAWIERERDESISYHIAYTMSF